jgi:hypothetical protein
MPTQGAPPMGPPPDSDGIEGLWRLAAKGNFAVLSETAEAGIGDYVICSARGAAAQPLAVVPGAAFARARSRGWIEPDGEGGRYRLTAAGLKALRQARSGPATSARKSRPQGRPAASPLRGAVPKVRAAQERPLAWLRRRKDKDGQPLVTEPQFAAGERLAADFWHAHLMPRVTADWSSAATSQRTRRAAPGVGVELGDNVVAARQRVNRALSSVGPELAGILVDVCCHDLGLETAERAQGWPQRSGKIVLQLALTRLARHYGLILPDPRPGGQRPRHWGSDDSGRTSMPGCSRTRASA